jgi:hypothetical protein
VDGHKRVPEVDTVEPAAPRAAARRVLHDFGDGHGEVRVVEQAQADALTGNDASRSVRAREAVDPAGGLPPPHDGASGDMLDALHGRAADCGRFKQPRDGIGRGRRHVPGPDQQQRSDEVSNPEPDRGLDLHGPSSGECNKPVLEDGG